MIHRYLFVFILSFLIPEFILLFLLKYKKETNPSLLTGSCISWRYLCYRAVLDVILFVMGVTEIYNFV